MSSRKEIELCVKFCCRRQDCNEYIYSFQFEFYAIYFELIYTLLGIIKKSWPARIFPEFKYSLLHLPEES